MNRQSTGLAIGGDPNSVWKLCFRDCGLSNQIIAQYRVS